LQNLAFFAIGMPDTIFHRHGKLGTATNFAASARNGGNGVESFFALPTERDQHRGTFGKRFS
jgi:hypothetical protein